MVGQTVYACCIFDEVFYHMEELKKHIDIKPIDVVKFFSAKETNTNVGYEN